MADLSILQTGIQYSWHFKKTLAETHSCFFLISPKIFLFHQNFEVFANLKLRYEKLVPIKIIVCCFYSIGRCVSGSPKDKRRAIESDQCVGNFMFYIGKTFLQLFLWRYYYGRQRRFFFYFWLLNETQFTHTHKLCRDSMREVEVCTRVGMFLQGRKEN